jgi:hypothetical protein
VEPEGTAYQGDPCNSDVDVNNDCSDKAYITGNGGGGAGDDDVDDGTTTLTGPVFDLTGYMSPSVRYARWFFNDGGQGAVNDEMIVSLTNGIDTVMIELIDDGNAGMGTWVVRNWNNWALLAPTANMRLIVSIADEAPGHLVEGGLDKFEIEELSGAGVAEIVAFPVNAWPNPNDGSFTVSAPAAIGGSMQLMDAQGRAVGALHSILGSEVRIEGTIAPGIYTLRVQAKNGSISSVRLVVR